MSHYRAQFLPVAFLFLALHGVRAQNVVSTTAQVPKPHLHDFPIVEFSGGVSYARPDVAGPTNMIGWHFTFGMNPARSLRLLGDFSHQQAVSDTILHNGVRSTIEGYQLVWGPEFVYRRNPRIQPFAHTLVGVAARYYETPSTSPGGNDIYAHDFGFASAFGGGVDIAVQRWVAIRVIQADLSLERRSWVDEWASPAIPQLPPSGNWQVQSRLSAGIVIRVGAHSK